MLPFHKHPNHQQENKCASARLDTPFCLHFK